MSTQSPASPTNGVLAGRYTAQIEGDFVVFLIGSQLNTMRALNKFRRIGNQMGEMLTVLNSNPAKGFLGGENFYRFFPFTTALISYWRSFEDLEHFSRSKDEPHASAWSEYNRLIGSDGTIGVWHETYLVPAQSYECVYANMPAFGLGKATTIAPVSGRSHTARKRLGQDEAQARVPVVE